MSRKAAAKYIKKSKAFVNKWLKRFEETKTVDDLPERGVKRKTTDKEEKQIVNMFSSNPGLSLRQGQARLKKKGLRISCETIRSRLRAHNLKYRSAINKPLLTENHVEKRNAWARANIDRNWNNVVFSDEASFWAQVDIYE